MIIFAGISNAMYETKNAVRAILYLLESRCKSFDRENSCAFPMFTLSNHIVISTT
jgi:hypothetical protein